MDVSADGRYLVRQGPWGGPLGVAFYDRGRLMRAYDVADLVSDMARLHHTTSHYFWIDEWRFLPHAARLHLSTLAGDQHVFDATTGERVSTRRYEPPSIAARLTLTGGATTQLGAVRLCGVLSPLLFAFGNPGADAGWTLVATTGEESHGDGSSSAEIIAVNLADVVRIDRQDGESRHTGADTRFRLQVIDGTVLDVGLEDGTSLCGSDPAGGLKEYRLADTHAVRLCAGDGEATRCGAR